MSECHRAVALIFPVIAKHRETFIAGCVWHNIAPELAYFAKYLYAVSPRELIASAQFVNVQSEMYITLKALATAGDVPASVLKGPWFGSKADETRLGSMMTTLRGALEKLEVVRTVDVSNENLRVIYESAGSGSGGDGDDTGSAPTNGHEANEAVGGATATAPIPVAQQVQVMMQLVPASEPSPVLASLRSGFSIQQAVEAMLSSNMYELAKATHSHDDWPSVTGWDLFDVFGPDTTVVPEMEARICELCSQLVAGPNVPITVEAVTSLHRALNLADDVDVGVYRREPVVGSFMFYRFYRSFLPADEIQEGMDILCESLNAPEMHELHPFVQAHYAFSTLVYFIHPFEDGNGRIARLIGNIILKRNGYPWAIDHTDKILTMNSLLQKIAFK